MYDAHEQMLAMERNHTINHSQIIVEVYAHVIMESENVGPEAGSLTVTEDDIHENLKTMNTNYRPADISFKLKDAQWVREPEWLGGRNADMQKALHEGGSSTLNIYYTNYMKPRVRIEGGAATFPVELESPDGPLLDGLVIDKLFASLDKRFMIREIGHWFGLLHSFEDICNDGGDYIDDTPPTPKSCYEDVFTCPGNNFMGYGPDEGMFTPGQITRLHSLWTKYRASGTAAPEIALAPLNSTDNVRTKRPFYPDPESWRQAYRKCHPKADGRAEETRESYCGTENFCRWGLYKLAGEQYASVDACLESRTADLLPWIMPKPDLDRFDEFCPKNQKYIVETVCGTDSYCKAFDWPVKETPASLFDARGQDTTSKYSNSTVCFEDHFASPEMSPAEELPDQNGDPY
ncbi:pregnancy-associated plasma protein-A domain-containing protein [Hirsutella rhossiliensis]|uniref:Pregnancy-associated plasma protein-A domain-containing protein n=1 Tax=Hirsutella rhossiliensis TaxID=111463 RepID=A0A9P8MMT8_9HYPO|nr:pregnancy-associated plasma protein-A domain-containing protein [Hirsutella rhossiliensis]KAH0957862.1 pregnancy-associated plasma protein-A domain-containing protein [Hirsutella rhossiliensis]